MAVTATGVQVLSEMIAGAWKFHRYGDYEADVATLAALAQTLVNVNPGGGIYHDAFVRSTGRNELGICFIYEPHKNEWDPKAEHPRIKMEPYQDFFRRRCGIHFKGYDIGHSVTKITLEPAAT